MLFIIILSLFCLLVTWLLTAPLLVEIDTRIPKAELRWISIGKLVVQFEEEWQLSFQVLFFRKTIRFADMKRKDKKPAKKKPAKKKSVRRNIAKGIKIIRSFRVQQWQLALDTGDHTTNARLYPANFIPHLHQHLLINFNGENYLYLRIRNQAWRMLYAFVR